MYVCMKIIQVIQYDGTSFDLEHHRIHTESHLGFILSLKTRSFCVTKGTCEILLGFTLVIVLYADISCLKQCALPNPKLRRSSETLVTVSQRRKKWLHFLHV